MRHSFRLRQLTYDLRENLLFRPALVLAACAFAGTLLPLWEATWGASIGAAVAATFPMEPGSAQVVLGTLAGAMMTIVSVVYSTLLVALSLASIQFSTRILASFMRDRPAQNTLGMLVGTFVYTLLVLRSVRTEPPFVPVLSVFSSLALALASLGTLVWFIHYMVRGIQANNLVDRLARETEPVIDSVFGPALAPGEEPAPAAHFEPPEGAVPILALRSGYVQLVSRDALGALATGGALVVARGMGHFVAEGAPLVWWRGPAPISPTAVDAAFDIGPVRTMQDDAEWGLRQIVDIGLKAISPAVNDPSTGCTCVDQLSRLLVRAAPLRTPIRSFAVEGGAVHLPTTSFVDLVRVAFEQLRQYGRADMAVSLRILRALVDIAEATPHAAGRAELLRQGSLAWAAARKSFPEAECDELDARWARLQEECAAAA
ncbi:MAG: DUF2254 domain-containing protein [Pseudomonadota bacterium]|nr:DUF2254 domain-containing protein [Pseudomonadota bacterium]